MNGTEDDFEALLRHVQTSRGFVFSGYKRNSVRRRVARRMECLRIYDHGTYLDYLRAHESEFKPFFDAILCNPTGFFRDLSSWRMLQNDLLRSCLRSGPVRVWSAGCATGEEAYTLAIVLAESLGLQQYCERVKIFATDVDQNSLEKARTARYSELAVGGCPGEYLERYFTKAGACYTVSKDIRSGIVFGHNDLAVHPPISRVNLLACRNTLMYLQAAAQARALQRLHFGLDEGGLLFLGRSEAPHFAARLFKPVDSRRRFFNKIAGIPRSYSRTAVRALPGRPKPLDR
nr:protein-glutamate O-methyltransferase CheR [Micromonospora sp. DSM 115978]